MTGTTPCRTMVSRAVSFVMALPPKLFDPLLHALVTSGQIRAVNRNGDVVYFGIGL